LEPQEDFPPAADLGRRATDLPIKTKANVHMTRELKPWFWLCLAMLALGCGRPGGAPVPPTREVRASEPLAGDAIAAIERSDDDWPGWRGPNQDGVATGPEVPWEWSETKNVLWSASLPGRGHSSPIVVGDRVILASAIEGASFSQLVIAMDRTTGKEVWKKTFFQGGAEAEVHKENTQASSTLAWDGQRLFATFLNSRKIWVVALDLQGEELWRREVGGFSSKFGYSASPAVYGPLVLVAADHQQGGWLAGLRRDTGDVVWLKNRPAKSSYASPRVISLGGKDQLVICGCNVVASLDPLTGEANWETPGSAEAGVGTLVASDGIVFASAGYPERETLGLQADGSVAWRNKTRSYCPSLLAWEGNLYQLDDDGIVRCFEGATGKERWTHRVGGRFRASPILLAGHIVVTDMSGKSTVFRAVPEKFELVAENQLGSEGFASPAISQGRLFLRAAAGEGNARRETLYCIGTKE
jgi:outer membrane protein assembly factor BamB